MRTVLPACATYLKYSQLMLDVNLHSKSKILFALDTLPNSGYPYVQCIEKSSPKSSVKR